MAGIGFQLAKTAREGGVGGIVGAAAFGAIISAGPWLITAVAMALLDGWSLRHLGSEGGRVVQTVLVYAFSLSALAAAPIGILATRMAADRIFARDAAGVTGIVIVALAAGGALALAVGALVFGFLAGLPLLQATIATIILAWLTQIWIAAPLLTALRRYRAVPLAYLLGIAFAATALLLLPHPGITSALAVIAAGIGLTLAAIVRVIRGHFATIATLPPRDAIAPQLARIVAAAGVAAVAAIWIDKWLLWVGPDSIAAVGLLRLNPINDQGSFLGLLTMVPGLTLILIVAETRFDRAFGDLIARCTGTSTLERIEEARRDVAATLLDGLRLLVLVQALAAALSWVLAVPLFDWIGADARAIFAFRQTSLGAVFHLVAIAATVVLAYYDLFGRILMTWSLFAIGSAIATLLQWDQGFAAFGWGYMAGAVVGASVGLALVAEATVNLTYLLFVGNNPSVVGHGGRLL
ncbi:MULTISPECIES: exopolysaccharide Pel transporter PelG [unclassified Sphingomonas]|uniref:exopolysaccharide Pel transporter PelG n=1 Tax=unclassified Sphingomonas TaxID=196159 RepID=UPI0025FA5F82|nr:MULTISPECIES: exopolysaccharide Pel transporter PelG [unclassified Sphingomonas]